VGFCSTKVHTDHYTTRILHVSYTGVICVKRKRTKRIPFGHVSWLISLDDAFSAYQIACEEYEREAEDKNAIQTCLKDLETYGYVLLMSGDDGTLVGTEFPLERLAKALEESLKQALQLSEEH
jgi:hypothetical protein